VHEDVPRQILGKTWLYTLLRPLVSKAVSLIEWLFSRVFASGIVAATPTIGKRFPKKITVIVQNFPVEKELSYEECMPYLSRPNNIVYIGGVTKKRGVIENISALDYINNDCRLLLAGTFESNELQYTCQEMSAWDKVEYFGQIDRQEVKRVLNTSRVGLVTLHPLINYIDSYPVKLFEYMSAGIPVVASDFPLWRRIIQNANCGLLVDPMQPAEISEAVDWLLENPLKAAEMGKNGKKAVLEKYNWRSQCKILTAFYLQLHNCGK